jgi:arsenite-transporting ATPase
MSLDSLVQTASQGVLKFVFVGGKGGVGKTTTSSALATLLSTATHQRVLLISTDPAHSLGDAWRTSFSNEPKQVPLPQSSSGGSLHVMELDPQQSMQKEVAEWAQVSEELFDGGSKEKGSSSAEGKTQSDEWMERIHKFQEWLSGIPGIDEATALSSAITYIESGDYDLIVFDTAPTGHTLKLLGLPAILEQGIEKLQSWQTTFWGYWQAIKAASGGDLTQAQRKTNLKQRVTDKLVKYKESIQKVACMLQDQTRTRFVAVCLAEYLSVSETQRLLQQLSLHGVVSQHIVVNQLVLQDALSPDDLANLEGLAEVGSLNLPKDLLQKTVHACRLTTARKLIQQRYLQDLKSFPETQSILDGICEVPLLADEVTGPDAIHRFSKLLVSKSVDKVDAAPIRQSGTLYDKELSMRNEKDSYNVGAASNTNFMLGDTVQVIGLVKSPQFNGLKGKISQLQNAETGRYGVTVNYQNKPKTLALNPDNIAPLEGDRKRKGSATELPTQTKEDSENQFEGQGLLNKAKSVLDDPEIKDLLAQNPHYQKAVEECLSNPMSIMKYLGDPALSPLISKVMSKM